MSSRRILAAAALLGLLGGACVRAAPESVEAADDCEGLLTLGLAAVDDLLTELGALTDLDLLDHPELPRAVPEQPLAGLAGDAFEVRFGDLGCQPADERAALAGWSAPTAVPPQRPVTDETLVVQLGALLADRAAGYLPTITVATATTASTTYLPAAHPLDALAAACDRADVQDPLTIICTIGGVEASLTFTGADGRDRAYELLTSPADLSGLSLLYDDTWYGTVEVAASPAFEAALHAQVCCAP